MAVTPRGPGFYTEEATESSGSAHRNEIRVFHLFRYETPGKIIAFVTGLMLKVRTKKKKKLN